MLTHSTSVLIHYMLPHRTAVRIRTIIIASQGCRENKMRSCPENAWQSAWHNRSTQQMVEAFKVPTDFKDFLSPHSPWRPAPEARGPRAPARGVQKQRTVVSGVRSCSSPLDPGGRKDPLPPCPSRGPGCAGKVLALPRASCYSWSQCPQV